jgi:hypothetical protein
MGCRAVEKHLFAYLETTRRLQFLAKLLDQTSGRRWGTMRRAGREAVRQNRQMGGRQAEAARGRKANEGPR